MKTKLIAISTLLMLIMGFIACKKEKEEEPKFKKGQAMEGGVIFYVDDTGEHGFIVAQTDFPDQTFGTGRAATWGCKNTYVSGATGAAAGTGKANTAAIAAACADTSLTIAACICDSLKLDGYNDWFLPSVEEWKLMIDPLAPNSSWSIPVTYHYNYYWTSTQIDTTKAYEMAVRYNSAYIEYKNMINAVRCIRSF